MLDDQNQLLTQFLTLWAMLDPIAHLPLFLGATGDMVGSERRRAAVIGVLIAFFVLIFFGIAGQFILEAMGISLMSFQIAGGIILLLFSVSMVLGDPPSARSLVDGKIDALNIAIYPLATPIIAGPGSMLAIVLLTDNNRFTVAQQAMTLGVLAVVLLLLLIIFLLGDSIGRLIGRGGTNVLRRVMGIIIAAISVNLIVSALAQWLHLPPILSQRGQDGISHSSTASGSAGAAIAEPLPPPSRNRTRTPSKARCPLTCSPAVPQSL